MGPPSHVQALLRPEVVLGPVAGVAAVRGGFTAEELADLREQFGGIWYALSTLLGHDDPEVTKDTYLEPFTALQVDYLMALLDEDEQPAVDALIRTVAHAGAGPCCRSAPR